MKKLILALVALFLPLYATAPSLIVGPASGSKLSCHNKVPLFYANAFDAVDGDISDRVQWDNGQVGPSAIYRWNCGHLGTHSVTASVTNSQGETTTETVVFTVGK